MPIPHYRAKRDGVEKPIVAQLRAIPGVSVAIISVKDVGDFLVGREDSDGVKQTWLIELKSKGGKLTEGQKRFREQWKGQHAVCSTLEEILKVIGF